ncbi:ABC transporter periplasmic protein [Secundilactobacillus paracollinoides DSM 15502 = JCM 11969]|nr:ABC transporter periplasmic protein [Secundilactobacillus paracollinoides DSM 15502 = JCM 11969]
MGLKKVIIGLGSVALALTLAACGNQSSQSGSGKMADKQVLNLSTTDTISTLDDSQASESISLTQLYSTGEGLYRLGKDFKLENTLAKSSTESKDGLTYTFKLRTNDKWQNGQKVTAKDFVYSWRRTADPKTKAGYAYIYDGLKNFSAI